MLGPKVAAPGEATTRDFKLLRANAVNNRKNAERSSSFSARSVARVLAARLTQRQMPQQQQIATREERAATLLRGCRRNSSLQPSVSRRPRSFQQRKPPPPRRPRRRAEKKGVLLLSGARGCLLAITEPTLPRRASQSAQRKRPVGVRRGCLDTRSPPPRGILCSAQRRHLARSSSRVNSRNNNPTLLRSPRRLLRRRRRGRLLLLALREGSLLGRSCRRGAASRASPLPRQILRRSRSRAPLRPGEARRRKRGLQPFRRKSVVAAPRVSAARRAKKVLPLSGVLLPLLKRPLLLSLVQLRPPDRDALAERLLQ